MSEQSFVPDDFEAPRTLAGEGFVLEPLGPEHNESDHAAWMSSIDHIRATPGFQGSWPPVEGMSLEDNLGDLTRHRQDFEERKGFTFTILDPDSREVIGCLYLYPTKDDGDVSVRSWVSADHAELDEPLAEAIKAWLEADWPWGRLDRRGR